ncbi:hypothetical protein [uncultured Kordia sp.]|uniref:hypothetical protein n=1 Tax=uncultured Kordia sp. TaxID=507699 RepID=UPI00260D87CB|nr:hypothetical protein [uncultured Kordia sp.]
MKKKSVKRLEINKLKISKIDFSNKIKGGSEARHCPENTIYPACPSGAGCAEDTFG